MSSAKREPRASGVAPDGPAPLDLALWLLLAAAVLTRLAWVMWVHPPQEHVFSDMAHYVHRARQLASLEVEPGTRSHAWQAFGTHMILAVPLLLLGPEGSSALELAGLMWAAMSAAAVVLGYLLARRVLPPARVEPGRPHWAAIGVGVVLLLWFPLISHAGFFISETPYALLLLATTHGIVVLIQDGRGALRAGVFGALAFAVRPQVAVFFVMLGLSWLVSRLRRRGSGEGRGLGARVGPREALIFAAPIVAMLAFSMVRFRVHTGHWGGVAENASMNLTAGRCHNIVTRSFPNEAALAEAATQPKGASRRISLPGFRALGREGPDHPLALDPALGGESIDFVGYIGDATIHREIRARCYAASGLSGQLRYSLTNVALAWVMARPWPESSDRKSAQLLPVAVRARDLAALLAPLSLLGLALALGAWARVGAPGRDPREADHLVGLGVCALQLASLIVISAVFFGTPRLRVPYDPYALLLALALPGFVTTWLRSRDTPTSTP